MTKSTNQEFVREVTARYIGPRRKSIQISSPKDAADFMRQLLRDDAREHFLALYLNGAHKVISFSLVSLGSANAAPVHAREVFQPALIVGAVALVIGHNHPSEELALSAEDKQVTEKLRDAGKLLGIPVLDHVVFSNKDYVSFREKGL